MKSEIESDTTKAGEARSEGFGLVTTERRGDLAAVALAEQAKASIQAGYIVALQRPRDLMKARARLLDDARRPGFAETAIYHKPVGDGVEGPSIRMAEAAARAMGNVRTETSAIHDDADKRIVRVCTTDLESNIVYTRDVTIEKTLERRKPMDGRKILAQRKNSRGDTVYVIEATSDEVLDKENALVSKAMRVCLLRLIPGDLLEEAMQQCYATRKDKSAKDPAAARKKMADAFSVLGVSVDALADYMGHGLEAVTIDELEHLRNVYNAVKDRETTWREVLEDARGRRGEASGKSAVAADAGPAGVVEKLRRKAAGPRASSSSQVSDEVKPEPTQTIAKGLAVAEVAEVVEEDIFGVEVIQRAPESDADELSSADDRTPITAAANRCEIIAGSINPRDHMKALGNEARRRWGVAGSKELTKGHVRTLLAEISTGESKAWAVDGGAA